MSSDIELVVTTVATRLMAADAATSAQLSQLVLVDLVSRFGVDAGVLGQRDAHSVTADLIASWPPVGAAMASAADPVSYTHLTLPTNREV